MGAYEGSRMQEDNEKRYTLSEAVNAINKVKDESGLSDFWQKEIAKAELRGYDQALKDMAEAMNKLLNINEIKKQ